MRVLIVSRIFTPEPAAASFALRAVAEELRGAGDDVTVLTTRAPAGMAADDPPGVRVKRARVLRDRSGYVRGYLQYLSFDVPLFFRLLFAGRHDVILVEPPPTTGAVVRAASALLRTPYVYDAADIWSDAVRNSGGSPVVARVLLAVERFAMRGARELVTISDGVERRLRELGIRTPTSITGFGADTASFAFHAVEQGADDPIFVYPGSYSAWHGAEVLVQAFAMFATRHPRHRLVFIGNGTERERLQDMGEQLGIGDRVEFRASVDPQELSRVLSGAQVALASLSPDAGYDYAFTTKVYSALAAGCPVIFTGPGPTAAFLDEAAATVPVGVAVPFDPAAVAGAMEAVAQSPLSSTARRSLARWTSEEHSLAAVARRIRSVVARSARTAS